MTMTLVALGVSLSSAQAVASVQPRQALDPAPCDAKHWAFLDAQDQVEPTRIKAEDAQKAAKTAQDGKLAFDEVVAAAKNADTTTQADAKVSESFKKSVTDAVAEVEPAALRFDPEGTFAAARKAADTVFAAIESAYSASTDDLVASTAIRDARRRLGSAAAAVRNASPTAKDVDALATAAAEAAQTADAAVKAVPESRTALKDCLKPPAA
jgi:hypothetical protein